MISICCLSWQFILQDQTDNHTPDNDDVCFFIPWDKDRMKIRRRDEKIETKIEIKVITKLPNSEQSYKGKVQTHNYINRQNQSTTGKLWKP